MREKLLRRRLLREKASGLGAAFRTVCWFFIASIPLLLSNMRVSRFLLENNRTFLYSVIVGINRVNPDEVFASGQHEYSQDGHAAPRLIRIEKITKLFRSNGIETLALSDASLSIARGEYVALTGPSGCGKSTLLSIIGLLDSPTTGAYFLDGRDTATRSYSEKASIRNQEIGFVFQSFNLIEEMNVEDNLALPLSFRRGITTSERRDRVHDALRRVGMDSRAKQYPGQLSGGEQQRVAIARALAGSPSILLADEPTGNLDSHNADAIMQLLAEAHQDGNTVCIVTHDARFADCADRQIRLFDGRVSDLECNESD